MGLRGLRHLRRVGDRRRDRPAHDGAEHATAAQHAFQAGLDVVFQFLTPSSAPTWTRSAAASWLRVVDAAVARVLRAKFELGCSSSRTSIPTTPRNGTDMSNHRQLARESARASIVLLKNERTSAAARPNRIRVARRYWLGRGSKRGSAVTAVRASRKCRSSTASVRSLGPARLSATPRDPDAPCANSP